MNFPILFWQIKDLHICHRHNCCAKFGEINETEMWVLLRKIFSLDTKWHFTMPFSNKILFQNLTPTVWSNYFLFHLHQGACFLMQKIVFNIELFVERFYVTWLDRLLTTVNDFLLKPIHHILLQNKKKQLNLLAALAGSSWSFFDVSRMNKMLITSVTTSVTRSADCKLRKKLIIIKMTTWLM